MFKLITKILLAFIFIAPACAQEVKVDAAKVDFSVDLAASTEEADSDYERLELLQKVAYVPVRQTVLTGPVDASGAANFLSASALTVTVSDELTVIATVAQGFDVTGSLDYNVQIPVTSLELPASRTCYIYVEYNKSGIPELYYTVIAPVYSNVQPTETEDTFWFDFSNYKMTKYVDGMWSETLTVFLGQATSDASEITSVITYAYQGKYYTKVGNDFTVSADFTFASCIGTSLCKTSIYAEVTSNVYGFLAGDLIELGYNYSPASVQFEITVRNAIIYTGLTMSKPGIFTPSLATTYLGLAANILHVSVERNC